MRKLALSMPVLLFVSAFGLSGCSTSFDKGQATSANVITGTVYGGRQPIIGAHIYMFSPGVTAYGGSGIAATASNASVSLLNSSVPAVCGTGGTSACVDGNGNYYVVTNSYGGFTLTGEYSCTSAQPVYLYSVQGDPGGGTNTAAGLMASIGTCPLSSSLRVNMNEASTVAAAYAIAGFASDATHIGTSGSTLAATGIANAFANAAQMYNISASGEVGALATTPGGNGTVPQSELNTLANILAACVNSVGPGSPACSSNSSTKGLFYYATSNGTTGGTVATDTATAAIYIAQNPAANVTALFNIPTGTVPYAPNLGTTAPNDWTVGLAFTGGGLTQAYPLQPHGLAFDASGNAWIASGTGTVLSEFSPLGVPANTSGYALSLNQPLGVAIDVNSTNVWIGDFGDGSVTDFTISGATYATYSPGSAKVRDIAIDGSGNPWIVDSGNQELLKLNASTGAAIFTSASGANGLNVPVSLAIEPGASGNVWVANGNNCCDVSAFYNSGAAFTEDSNGGIYFAYGSAIDSQGYIWFSLPANYLSKLSSDGTAGNYYTVSSGSHRLDSIAIDGAGNAWMSDSTGGTVFELNNAATNISGTSGYVPVPATTPEPLAIDGSGNVWYASSNAASLRELVGAAVPVATPLAYGVANSKLGTRP